MQKIARDILVETGYQGGNLSCVLTEEGKVLVDVPYFPQEVTQWQRIINESGPGEVAFVVNTDHHFDHSIGNCCFNGKVVGHMHAYEEMLKPGGTLLEGFLPNIEAQDAEAAREIKGYPIIPPSITFDKSLTLHMGDKTLEVIRMGGHTSATSSVYIPELKTLLAGDVIVSENHPFMGQADPNEWVKSLELIREMDIENIVPGHGEVCGMEAVDRLMGYFKEFRKRVEELVKAGKRREEVPAETDMLEYFQVEEESLDMAVFCVQSAAECFYNDIVESS